MRLIHTQGRGLEAEVEIEGERLRVLDALSPVEEPRAPGDLEGAFLEVEAIEALTQLVADPGAQALGFEPERGWRYRATGEIISREPLVVDFGVLRLELAMGARESWKPGDRLAVAVDRIRLVKSARQKAGA